MDSKRGPSKFAFFHDVPATWDEDLINKKCSDYGFVNEVTINRESRVAIVEFQDESDAADFVEDDQSGCEPNELRRSLHYPSNGSSDSNPTDSANSSMSFASVDVPLEKRLRDGPFSCANPACSHILMEARGEVFCTPQCLVNSSSVPQPMDMFDKWLSALGRGGSGLLADHRKIDNIVVSVDRRGLRSFVISPPKGPLNKPH